MNSPLSDKLDDDVVDFVYRYGGRCRDCADSDGICPAKGLPCDPAEAAKVIGHVVRALNRRAALTASTDETKALREALEDVCDPIRVLQREADASGCRLNGNAYAIANDVHFIQRIARAALRATRHD